MMKLFSIGVVVLGLVGCQSASKPQQVETVSEAETSPSLFFEIKGAAPAGAVTPNYDDKTLTLGDLEVENWPSIKLDCDSCFVSSGREFHPDGPTQWLKIEGDEQSTLLVTSYQQRDFIAPLHVSFQSDALVIENRDKQVKTKIAYKALLPKKLPGSSCQLSWLKREAQAEVPEGISNDAAAFKTQFVVRCVK